MAPVDQEEKTVKKTMKNRLAVAGLCFTLTAGMLTGCSGNSGKAIITLDGQKTEYAVANIMLRYSQAQMQAFYGAYLGDNLWSQYGDSTKSTMMDTLKQMLILEQHQDEYNVSLTDDDKKKIDEAAQQFMDDNDQATLKSMGATKERVARVLELYTIRNKIFPCTVTFHNSRHHILRHIIVVCQKLLGIFRQAVSAVSK